MRLGSSARATEKTTSGRAKYDPSQKLATPFELTLHVDTVGDLASLWARFNMSAEVLSEAASNAASEGKKGAFSSDFEELLEHEPKGKRDVWKYLNGKLKENSIHPR